MVLAYLRKAQEVLNLNHWDVRLSDLTAGPDEYAVVDFTTGQHDAAVRFGRAFWSATRQNQRYVIIHELVHIHLRHLDTLTEVACEALDPAATAMMLAAHNIGIEYATDSIARVLVRLMPLPPVFGVLK